MFRLTCGLELLPGLPPPRVCSQTFAVWVSQLTEHLLCQTSAHIMGISWVIRFQISHLTFRNSGIPSVSVQAQNSGIRVCVKQTSLCHDPLGSLIDTSHFGSELVQCQGGGDAQTWLILPVVICLSQRLSHACLSISFYTAKLRMAH